MNQILTKEDGDALANNDVEPDEINAVDENEIMGVDWQVDGERNFVLVKDGKTI